MLFYIKKEGMTVRKPILRVTALVLSAVLVMLALCSCKKTEKFSGSFMDTFDTVITLSGYTADATAFNEYAAACHTSFLHYHELFDIYNDYPGINNIKTINDNAGKEPVKVDAAIIDLIEDAVEYCRQTNGKVNIAMGSVLAVWHNYRERALADPQSAAVPSKAILTAASGSMDINDIVIDKNNGTVFLNDPGLRLDVGAIAKGYACQKVAEELKRLGFENFVINAGGNVYASGKPDESGAGNWSVGVKNPDTSGMASTVDSLSVTDAAVVTAGGYQRYYTVDGKDYCHIIDPETLMPADQYLSVTVIAPDSALADFMATTLYLTDYEEGVILCRRMGVDALWITSSGQMLFTDGYLDYSSMNTN